MKKVFLFLSWLAFAAGPPVHGIGIVTHMEMAERARQVYILDPSAPYAEILRKHPDAFRAGAVFPDWGFAPSPVTGKSLHPDAAEAAHWTPFYEAAAEYLRERPKPWDEGTEKLAAFLMGALAHGVTDMYWHNMYCAGPSLGLLQALSNDDFSRDYNFLSYDTLPPPPPVPPIKAHQIGDMGSDPLSSFSYDLSWIPANVEIPADALLAIYKLYDQKSGKPPLKVTREQLVEGAVLEHLYCLVFKQAEGNPILRKLVDGIYLPFFAGRARFLVEQIQSYPSGGIDDTAALTAFSWPTLSGWFAQPPAAGLPDPYLHCPKPAAGESGPAAPVDAPPPPPKEIQEAMRKLAGGLQVRQVAGGVMLVGSPAEASAPAAASKGPIYAYLGSSVALGPGLLVAGAPGYSLPGRPRAGAVLVRAGETGEGRIAPSPDFLRPGSEAYARFGQAVALIDLNADGRTDLAVSAPDSGAATLAHRGKVFVYFGTGDGFPPEPDLTLEPDEDQGRFGWVLKGADCDGDGFADLVVGSPFASGKAGARQGGQAAIYLASAANRRGSRPRPAWVARGERPNDGFGSAVAFGADERGRRILAVGAPGVKNGGHPGVGRIYGYALAWNGAEPAPLFTVTGSRSFARLGSALALGDPRRQRTLLLAAGSPTDDGNGKTQAGSVVLLPVAALRPGQSVDEVPPVVRIRGTQAFARFGWRLELADVDGDGVDDLLASEPMRQSAAGPAAGAAYAWFGGPRFPAGDAAPESAPWKTASPEKRAWLGGALAVRPGLLALGVERSSLDATLGGAVVTFAPRP
jgi:hypothetical protein